MNMVFIGLAVASTLIAAVALATRHRTMAPAALAATYAFLIPAMATRPHASVVVPMFIAIVGLQMVVACCAWIAQKRGSRAV